MLGLLVPTARARDDANTARPQLLAGLDYDLLDNAALQAGATANRLLNRTDILIGGSGTRDALVLDSTDRGSTAVLATGVRLPTFLLGIPTASVTRVTRFCTIEISPLPANQYLLRILGAAGNLIVTMRVSGVEQVFCSGQGGGAITMADLIDPSPSLVVISHRESEHLNLLVGKMNRSPVATSNSPTRGRVKLPDLKRRDKRTGACARRASQLVRRLL